jgi:hypothetical protein
MKLPDFTSQAQDFYKKKNNDHYGEPDKTPEITTLFHAFLRWSS